MTLTQLEYLVHDLSNILLDLRTIETYDADKAAIEDLILQAKELAQVKQEEYVTRDAH